MPSPVVVVVVVVSVSVPAISTSIVLEEEEEVEEVDEVLRERGRRRWMRCEAVGQRGGEDIGGLPAGEESAEEAALLMLLRRLLLHRLGVGRRVLAGLG